MRIENLYTKFAIYIYVSYRLIEKLKSSNQTKQPFVGGKEDQDQDQEHHIKQD